VGWDWYEPSEMGWYDHRLSDPHPRPLPAMGEGRHAGHDSTLVESALAFRRRRHLEDLVGPLVEIEHHALG